MISAGSYLLSVAALLATGLSVGFAAVRLRRHLLPSWTGAPGYLVSAILAIALLIWTSELLGVLHLLYASTLVVLNLLLALGVTAWTRANPPLPGGGGVGGTAPEEALATAGGGGSPAPTGPAGPGGWSLFVMVIVIGVVVAHWALTTKSALDRGIFNFDSLWYHMPYATEMAQSHSVTRFARTETVFTNWFYPQNSELLHADGILLVKRDTLSLFLNFGWLALAFLGAWTIGRPFGKGHLSVVAVAILAECHTLVVREPGAAKNDLAAAALILAAVAILVTAWSLRERARGKGEGEQGEGKKISLPAGWPLAFAGLAVGLAAGTKLTVLAMAAALSVAVVVLAPAGGRGRAAVVWFGSAILGGGYWYLRNLVAVGNPLPQASHLGPISLPHPVRLQTARPDFNILHYATDTGIWSEYFSPGLHLAFGGLWPLVLLAAVGSAAAAIGWGRSRAVRWAGAVALFGMLAYLFTPLGAAGPEGEPTGFEINIRFVVPALLLALALLPLPRLFDDRRRQWGLLAALVLVLVLSDRSDAVLRDPDRVFAVAFALIVVGVPAALLALRRRGAPTAAIVTGSAALLVVVLAIGYPVQRDYLEARFANDVPAGERLPGEDLDSAYSWAHRVEDARIGLAGTTAGFLSYGFYGTDLSNRVLYMGEDTAHGGFQPIATCEGFRRAVNDADLDYLVTSPFLNFVDPSKPVPSPEARWLRGSGAVRPIQHEGQVTVWRVDGPLEPRCGRAQAPLREIPDSPLPSG